jgi:hypothetical protein
MPKLSPTWKKIIGYTLLSIFVLMLALWGILYWYVSAHKEEMIAKIEKISSNKIEGKVRIKDIQPDFIKDFPMISFRLDSLCLQDSLYPIYKTNLLEVEHVFARLNLFSLIKGSPSFSKITIENGKLHLFTDTNGYSNNYLLKSKDSSDTQSESKQGGLDVEKFELENFNFKITNKVLNKKFDFTVKSLNGAAFSEDTATNINFNVVADFKQLGFNLSFGSFLRNAKLHNTHFDVVYHKNAKSLTVKKTTLNLDSEKLRYEAFIALDKENNIPFTMYFEADPINYNVGAKWMSENIEEKLGKLKFEKPVALKAKLEGGFSIKGNPNIKIDFKTEKNKIGIFSYDLNNVAFTGRFNNQVDKTKGNHDSNSVVQMDVLTADFEGLPINGKDISLTNLKKPIAKAHLTAQFDAEVLNNIFDNQFLFTKGTAAYDLRYDGRLFMNTLIADKIFGTVKIDKFDFTYTERNLKFKNGTARLRFEGTDLYFDQLQIFSNNSDLNITGSSLDFLTAFMQLPGKAQMDVNLHSKNIDLAAFQTYFVQKRTSRSKPTVSTGTAVKNASNKLDEFLNNASVALKMEVQQASYKKFQINNLLSKMKFTAAGINIEHLKLNHADGNVLLRAGINQQAPNNPFFAAVEVNRVKVDKFMYAMNSFGFKGLTEKNVEGIFSVKGDLKGNITDRGVLLEQSLNGKLNYELSNAALKNFAFFDKVKRFFPNRNLEKLEIDHFAGHLTIQDGTIVIPATTLETSALNLSFAGKYGVAKGKPTALDLRVPLRNPQVDKRRIAQGKGKRKGEGIVLNFKATSGENGKINIGVGKTEGAKAEGLDWVENDEE